MDYRICKTCGDKFLPQGRHNMHCNKCRYKRCPICGNLFLIKPAERNPRKYCSKKCSSKNSRFCEKAITLRREAVRNRKTGKFVNCINCNKVLYRYPRDLKHKIFYCSYKCRSNYTKGISFSVSTQFKKKNNSKEKIIMISRERSIKRNIKLKDGGGHHSKKEFLFLKKIYNYTCPNCGKKEPEIKLTEDHIIPISRWNEYKLKNNLIYGCDDIQNIQPLCIRCNVKKGFKL